MNKIFEYVKKYDILILVIFGFFLYCSSLSFCFLDYDDFSLLLGNQYLNGRIQISLLDFFKPEYITNAIYSPLTFIVYWLVIKIFGVNSFVFHFVNIFFYLLSSVILFYLLKKIIANYSIVFFATVLYILHPCHIECTAWNAAMGYNISALFFYLSFLYFIMAFDENKKINYIFSVIFYILAIFSQPIAVTLPAVLLLWVYCFRRERLKESIKYICAYIPFLLVYLYLYSQTILKARFKENLNYTFIEKIGILGFDIFNSFLPINLCPIKSIPNVYFIFTLLILVLLLFYLRKDTVFIFFIGFGIIFILPYSNIFFDMSIPSSDR